MAKRGKIGQARHDGKVQQRLNHYKDQGFSVKADLPDRAKPRKIGGRIPDIVAKKGKQLIVEEIETASTKNSDKDQQTRLREGTKKLGGTFKIIIAK
ncbi:MAG: hypothetical protein A3A29_01825 [Candidatus Ryanbacteria bacterium RIFCSPLOWO2_01_FULL_47_79]|uniref:VRR-NUC domain-containing protein n=1 Tax=Candidatus Yanofskybacteria bacterium RIFCSPLOWO2_02_FULL_45_10 TaxID=1802706 RepID=A0A1F8H798_9BACT|nr:MAG: hypothetical protein A3I32_00835 [Candidatus Yanofskybacteria bacterium RIFCSPLOWO2_02_FULL_45_10]OGZ52715.1 MAG: hypothetical protein A3A29_01825 [Candidatus Ryanbacteria bacterium RIFCSPLOWO2_01_FULL_47_79]